MTQSLEDDLRNYAEFLDSTLAQTDAPTGQAPPGSAPAAPGRASAQLGTSFGWGLTATAAVVLAAFAGLFFMTSSEDVTPMSDTATSVGPDPVAAPLIGTWDLLVRMPADLAYPNNYRYRSAGELAAAFRGRPGIVEAIAVGDTEEDWLRAVGEQGMRAGCFPSCAPGVVVVARSAEALERASEVLRSWDWSIPARYMEFSERAAGAFTDLGNSRIEHLSAYIEAVDGLTGPEPGFETADLGREQPLVADTAPFDRLRVREPRSDVVAAVSIPDPERLEAGDVLDFGPMDTDRLRRIVVSVDVRCRCEGAPLVTTGSPLVVGAGIDTTSTKGLGTGPSRGAVGGAGWEDWVAFGIAGLPPPTAVVSIEFPDGARLWQRPINGMGLFVASSEVDFAQELPVFTGYDANGNVLLVRH